MTEKPSLLKQLAGALIGSAVALAIYYAYHYASPMVTAYLTLPAGEREHSLADVNFASDAVSDQKAIRTQSRNSQIADQLKAADPSAYQIPQSDWKNAWPEDFTAPDTTVIPVKEEVPVEQNDGWEDFVREELPPPSTQNDVNQAEIATHSAAPELPSSGFGAAALLSVAIGAVTGRRVTKKY